jgi:hypothetical protein
MANKIIILNSKDKNKDFYPNIDPDTFKIDGSKLSLKLGLKKDHACVMENLTEYRHLGDCMFASVRRIKRM